MKPLFYILRKSLKNAIKELTKKPAALISYIVLVIFSIFIIVMSFKSPSSAGRVSSVDTFGAIASGVLLITLYSSIKNGIKSGGSFFRLSDVNLLFTSPVSPNKILIYGFVKQLSATFISILFFIYQIPNLRNLYSIDGVGIFILYISVFLLTFSMPIIGMLIYSFTSTSKEVKLKFERVLDVLVAVFILLFLFAFYTTKDFKEAAYLVLNSKYFNYIPYIGWFKAVVVSAIEGVGTNFYINFSLIIGFIVLVLYIIYNMQTDYYEDVLAATEQKEDMLKLKKEGKGNISINSNTKVKKVRQAYRGVGARAVFYRQILEYKKTGLFFIDKTTLIMAAIGIASKLLMKGEGIYVALFFSVYMLFIFVMSGKWSLELGKPYIYLIPDTSYKKMVYSTLPETLKNGIDGLVLFIAAGFVYKADAISIILCTISYMTFGAIFIYGDILSRKLFGTTHSKSLGIFFKFILLIFIVMPGIIVSGVVSSNIGGFYPLSYVSMIMYNLLASFIIMFFAKDMFENIELNL